MGVASCEKKGGSGCSMAMSHAHRLSLKRNDKTRGNARFLYIAGKVSLMKYTDTLLLSFQK